MRISVSALASAVIATSLLFSQGAGACPIMKSALRPIATKSVTMLPDGGVLLSMSRSYGNRGNGTYTLVDETGATVEATQEQIAPGLFRLTPKQHADRELTLSEDGKPLFVVEDAAAAPALAIVPKLAKVTSTRARTTKPRPRYLAPEATTITLASPPPADVAGIVLYGADHAARAWLPANKGRTYQLSFGGKRCGGVGMIGTVIGEEVTIAFVDSSGRVSPRTKPVRVRRTPPPPPPKPATPAPMSRR